MPNTPVQPTKIKVASGSGTPGTFAGKNYRPSAPTKAQKKAATEQIVKALVDIESSKTGGVFTKDKTAVLQGSSEEIRKKEAEIKELQAQGGDLKKAMKEFEKTGPVETAGYGQGYSRENLGPNYKEAAAAKNRI